MHQRRPGLGVDRVYSFADKLPQLTIDVVMPPIAVDAPQNLRDIVGDLAETAVQPVINVRCQNILSPAAVLQKAQLQRPSKAMAATVKA
ncbi:hypothetical protein [Mesorhizobium sp. Root157]|uniref:hypothetical protein n=1 Tax=Mesorhizobium sp. Root157 TaxID=1736477 RepID=UPI0012E3E1F3|nr:hypothetical protein [Mesorhizobium sp. Root157]